MEPRDGGTATGIGGLVRLVSVAASAFRHRKDGEVSSEMRVLNGRPLNRLLRLFYLVESPCPPQDTGKRLWCH